MMTRRGGRWQVSNVRNLVGKVNGRESFDDSQRQQIVSRSEAGLFSGKTARQDHEQE